LIRKAWLLEPTPEGALRLTHDLFRADGTKMHVEAKVTRIGSWRLVVVVRDITQRLLVFEAEKALVKQATAHERDSAANRFTRHEVKNGLLSAIGLVDALQELSAPGTAREADRAPDAIGATARVSADDALGSLARCVGELQTTLTETLNSVLSETMARELVYDSYDPVPELVDVVALLKGHATGIGGAKGSRFKIETWPAEIPFLVLDPQLLHCIYRNAISNASKYGDPFGEVVTRLRLLRPDGTNASCAELHGAAAVGSAFTLTLEVFNEPGPDHSRLLDASGDALHDRVFAQGQRLHPDLRCANAGASTVSSGDGGWIMRKCAKALGGDCKIEFNLDGTVSTRRKERPPFGADG
jgi:signal transduction histidine kinase